MDLSGVHASISEKKAREWQKILSYRGMLKKCFEETKIKRGRISRLIYKRRGRVEDIQVLDKFFQQVIKELDNII